MSLAQDHCSNAAIPIDGAAGIIQFHAEVYGYAFVVLVFMTMFALASWYGPEFVLAYPS